MAAGGPVHGIHIPLTTTSKTAVAGLNKTARAVGGVGKAGKKASKATDLHTRASRRNTMAMLELSRGAEDFASQIGTTGISGALRASANNISQFATVMSPMAGVIVGAGVAAAAMVPMMLRMNDGVKKNTDNFNKLIAKVKQFTVVAKVAKDVKAFDFSVAGADAATVTQSLASLKEAKEIRSIETKDVAGRLKDLQAIQRINLQSRARIQGKPYGQRFAAHRLTQIGAIAPEQGLISDKELEKVEENINTLQNKLSDLRLESEISGIKIAKLTGAEEAAKQLDALKMSRQQDLDVAKQSAELQKNLNSETVEGIDKVIAQSRERLDILRAEQQSLETSRKEIQKTISLNVLSRTGEATRAALRKEQETLGKRHNVVLAEQKRLTSDINTLYTQRAFIKPLDDSKKEEEAAKRTLDLESKKLRLAKLTLSIRQRELQSQTKAAQAFAQRGQVGIAKRGSIEAFSAIEQAKRQTVLSKNPQQQELIKINNEIKEIEKKQLELQKKQLTREVASFS